MWLLFLPFDQHPSRTINLTLQSFTFLGIPTLQKYYTPILKESIFLRIIEYEFEWVYELQMVNQFFMKQKLCLLLQISFYLQVLNEKS